MAELDHRTLFDTDEVFSYEETSGRLTHFNVSAMYRGIERGLLDHQAGKTLVDADYARHMLSQGDRVEEPRVAALSGLRLKMPILMVGWDDGVSSVLVDGTHRYIRHWRDGERYIHLFLIPYGAWQPYTIDLPGRGTMDITDERWADWFAKRRGER